MNSCCWEWDNWVEEALPKFESLKVLRSLRPIHLIRSESLQTKSDELEFYDGLRQWDRASVEVQISEPTFQKWLQDIPSSGSTFCFPPPHNPANTWDDVVSGNGENDDGAGACGGKFKKLLIFSGNDYLGLSSHPTVIKAAVKAAQEHGMGPRGSA